MAKPLLEPTRWGTDETNNTAPSSGQRDTGWTPNQLAVSDYFNSLAKGYYDWFQWIDSGAWEAASLTLTGNLTVQGNTALGNGTGDTTTISGDVSIAGVITHGDWVVGGKLPYHQQIITAAGSITYTNSASGTYIDLGVSGDCYIPLPLNLASNERIKSLTVYFADNTNSNVTTAIYTGASDSSLVLQGSPSAPGSSITSQTVTLGTAALAPFGLWVRVAVTGGSTGPKPFAFAATIRTSA